MWEPVWTDHVIYGARTNDTYMQLIRGEISSRTYVDRITARTRFRRMPETVVAASESRLRARTADKTMGRVPRAPKKRSRQG